MNRPVSDATRQQLQQKDELILALTEQLEQAAEQLDRLQRQGADRRRGPAMGGLPADVVENQRQTLEDMQRLVQQWEDMQAALTLGRIEIQISELRDLVVQGQQTTAGHVMTSPGGGPGIFHEPAELQTPHPVHGEAEFHSGVTSEWERLKSQLLQEEETTPEPAGQWIAELPPLPEAPAPLQAEKASHEELIRAVHERDEYIARLRDRLRQTEVVQPTVALQQHEPGSEEYLNRVRWLEQRLEEHLRSAEVELSVERAKIARERAQMAQQHDLLERQLKKLGLDSLNELEKSSAPAGSPQERRWARFLGRSKPE